MDMKEAMKGFTACSVQYGNRKNNELAHELAALNRSMGDKVLITILVLKTFLYFGTEGVVFIYSVLKTKQKGGASTRR